VQTRTDFRNTILLNPSGSRPQPGKKHWSSMHRDDITSFRTTVEGSTESIGTTCKRNFFTQLPFAMSTKIPVEVATEDHVSIPLTLKNNTDKHGGFLTIHSPGRIKKQWEKIPSPANHHAGTEKSFYLDYEVLSRDRLCDLYDRFNPAGWAMLHTR